MKIDQLIEFNLRIIFLQKLFQHESFFAYKTQAGKFWLNFSCNIDQPFSYKVQSDK